MFLGVCEPGVTVNICFLPKLHQQAATLLFPPDTGMVVRVHAAADLPSEKNNTPWSRDLIEKLTGL
jgi:hypothetical protein